MTTRPSYEFYSKLHFRPEQLEAIKTLYKKYFEQFLPEKYDGTATSVLWYRGAKWVAGEGHDKNHKVKGGVVEEGNDDPLWKEHFGDLLPYMEPAAVITQLPPGETMHPHVDRSWRPKAIYFPISGCSDLCVSEYYDLPINQGDKNRQSQTQFPPPIFSYAINTHAYLTNTHEWHGVRNLSDQTRTAFGWNFRQGLNLSMAQCRDILLKLGYIREDDER